MTSALGSILERMLNRYLSPYFDGFDDGFEQFSVLSGTAKIGNLKMKDNFCGSVGMSNAELINGGIGNLVGLFFFSIFLKQIIIILLLLSKQIIS